MTYSGLRIILGMLFPTYHGPWPALGGILVRVLRRNLQYLSKRTEFGFYGNV